MYMNLKRSFHPRQQLIAPYRNIVTNQLNSSHNFVQNLEEVILQTKNPLPNKLFHNIVSKVAADSKLYIGRDSSSHELSILFKIALAAAHMARLLAPFYTSFATWFANINRHLLNRSECYIMFSGRDAIPLQLVFSKMNIFQPYYQKMITSPFNRGNIIHLYKRCHDQNLAKKEKQSVIDYYISEKLTDKLITVVDFGFFGTLERTHQLILYEAGAISRNILANHCLIVRMKRSIKDLTVFDKAISTNSFSRAKIGQLESIDKDYFPNIHGFINSRAIETKSFFEVDDQDLLISMDRPFIYWLQEIGSGITESRYNILLDRSEDYLISTAVKFASLQQIVGYIAFLENLPFFIMQNNPDAGSRCLEEAYREYKQHESFWQQFIAYEDRASSGISFEYEPLLAEMNQELTENNFQPISIPYDA